MPLDFCAHVPRLSVLRHVGTQHRCIRCHDSKAWWYLASWFTNQGATDTSRDATVRRIPAAGQLLYTRGFRLPGTHNWLSAQACLHQDKQPTILVLVIRRNANTKLPVLCNQHKHTQQTAAVLK